MSLTSEQQQVGDAPGYIHLTIAGRLDSITSAAFEQSFIALFAEPHARVLLDCTQLEYVASSGLRVVLMGAKRAHSQQGKLVIAGLQPQVHEVFAISGFLKILSVAPDLALAAQSLTAEVPQQT